MGKHPRKPIIPLMKSLLNKKDFFCYQLIGRNTAFPAAGSIRSATR